MGKRGPPPTPTEILKQRGSWRAGRREGEPALPVKAPAPPKWLREDARAAFRDLAKKLARMRVMTEVDVNALARYVTLFLRWRECEEVLAERGQTCVLYDKDGNAVGEMEKPEARLALKLSAELGKLEGQFGLTPSARTSIRVEVGAREIQTDDRNRFRVIAKDQAG